MTGGINDGKFEIKRGQGISHAIAQEIGLTNEQCKKVDWRSVFAIVNEAKGAEGNKVNWGGGNNLFGPGRSNYVVHAGDVFEFSKEIWTRIVDTVKNSLVAKGVGVDGLNELQVEEASAPEELPEAPKPYEGADRFESRAIDEERTQRTEVENGKMTTFFDSDGKKVKEVTLFNTNQTQETYYDTDGAPTHTIARNEEGAIMFAYAFDKDGKILSYQDEKGEVHREEGSDTSVSFYRDGSTDTISEYDSNGNKTKKTTYGCGGTVTGYSTYEYDSNGNNTKMTSYNSDGTVYKYYTYEYDSNGNKTKKTTYGCGGTVNGYNTYEYDSNGNNTKETFYNSDGTVDGYNTYEYDSNGNNTKMAVYDPDGTVHYYNTYEYDSNGNTTKETTYNSDGTVYEYYTHEYNSNGHGTKGTHYDSDGKITSYMSYERDADGVWRWVDHSDNGNEEVD